MTKNPLIIYDWDDTLFPTTWVTLSRMDVNNLKKSELYKKQFKPIDNMVFLLLKSSLRHGKVYIVTNASLFWVNTALKLYPQTNSIISNVEIISCRDLYSKYYPNMMNLWKVKAFNDILKYNSVHRGKYYQHIISIGDAMFERSALVNLKKNKLCKKAKNIKFLDQPTYKKLLEQIEELYNNFETICQHDKDLDMKMFNKN